VPGLKYTGLTIMALLFSFEFCQDLRCFPMCKTRAGYKNGAYNEGLDLEDTLNSTLRLRD
jgi:hypothetical protein